MIGIILWAILIIFIAECACPGFIWVTLGSMAVYGAVYFGIKYLVGKIKNKRWIECHMSWLIWQYVAFCHLWIIQFQALTSLESLQMKKQPDFYPTAWLYCDPSGLCESGIILLIINLLVDVIEKQCTTVCTTFSALFWRSKLPWFITTCESITKLTLIIRIFAK